MGIDAWTVHSTYRGITINQFTASATGITTYSAYTNTWVMSTTLSAVKSKIDEYLGPEPTPEPPEEPPEEPVEEPPEETKTLVETYRDIKIYRYDISLMYEFTHPTGAYRADNLDMIHTLIDTLLGPEEVPDTFIMIYGPHSIWKNGTTGRYYVIVDETPQGDFFTIEDAQAHIRDVLGFDPDAPLIVPGEEPDWTKMDPDPTRGAAISDPVKQFLTAVGLTPEALEAVRGSGADPAKAAAYAKSVSLASVGAIAILGTIGVVAEVASLGQVEGVLGTIDMVLEKSGIAGVLEEMFKIPFMEAVVKPAHHYWSSVYTPEIPGSGDLITFLVREIITPAEFNKTMALQGYSQKWADDYWEAHWRLPSIGDIIRAEHLGIITLEERNLYFILHDYRSDNRPGISVSDLEIYGGLTKQLLGRVDTRRAYQYGYMDRVKLIEMYTAQGYEEDATLQADIQIRASVDGLQSAIRREEGMMYRDRLKDAKEDESGAVSTILTERDKELTIILLRWNIANIPDIDLMLIPDAYKDKAIELGTITEEEAAILEADIRAKTDSAIEEVRYKAELRRTEVEDMYREALEAVKDLIDPEDLWVLRYKLAAERVEVAGEFGIEAPVLVEETAEEPV